MSDSKSGAIGSGRKGREMLAHKPGMLASRPGREMLISRTARIGVRTVEREGERYFLTIKNRTYQSEHEVPVEVARRHYRALRAEP